MTGLMTVGSSLVLRGASDCRQCRTRNPVALGLTNVASTCIRSSSKLTTETRTLIHCRLLHASTRTKLTMSPKQRTGGPQTVPGTPYSAAKSKSSNDAQDIVQGVWNRYVEKTPQRTKLLDSFMLFLVAVGALQFLYVVLVGNFVSTAVDIWTSCPGMHLQSQDYAKP